MLWTVIGVILIILIIGYVNGFSMIEDFATRQDKAREIIKLFERNPTPSYNDYRAAIKGNVVEYEDLIALMKSGRMNIDSVRRLL